MKKSGKSEQSERLVNVNIGVITSLDKNDDKDNSMGVGRKKAFCNGVYQYYHIYKK